MEGKKPSRRYNLKPVVRFAMDGWKWKLGGGTGPMLIKKLDVYPGTCTVYEDMHYGLCLMLLLWQLLVYYVVPNLVAEPSAARGDIQGGAVVSAQLVVQLLKLLAAIR